MKRKKVEWEGDIKIKGEEDRGSGTIENACVQEHSVVGGVHYERICNARSSSISY